MTPKLGLVFPSITVSPPARFARTSAAPGKTRLANVYRVQKGAAGPLYLVDLPGFGYAPDMRHYFDYHHSAADTLDKVEPEALAKSAAAVALVAYALAEMPQPLPRPPPTEPKRPEPPKPPAH